METARSEPESDDDLALLAEIEADPERAARRILSLENRVLKLKKELAFFAEERRLDRIKRFGASADRGEHQYRLFDEAEAHEHDTSDDDAKEVDTSDEVKVAAHTKRKAKRKPLPKDLPRVIVDHELAADERHCVCGSELTLSLLKIRTA